MQDEEVATRAFAARVDVESPEEGCNAIVRYTIYLKGPPPRLDAVPLPNFPVKGLMSG